MYEESIEFDMDKKLQQSKNTRTFRRPPPPPPSPPGVIPPHRQSFNWPLIPPRPERQPGLGEGEWKQLSMFDRWANDAEMEEKEQKAIKNFAKFYDIEESAVILSHVINSSAGIDGWAMPMTTEQDDAEHKNKMQKT